MVLFLYGERTEIRIIREIEQWKEYSFTDIQTAYSPDYADRIEDMKTPDLIIVSAEFDSGRGIRRMEKASDRFPGAALVLLGSVEHIEDMRTLLHIRALDILPRPVTEEAVKKLLALFFQKRQFLIKAARDREAVSYWERNHALIQEQYWKDLCLGRGNLEAETIEDAARQVGIAMDKDSRFAVALILMKDRESIWAKWGENYSQRTLRDIASRYYSGQIDGSRIIIIYNCITIIFRDGELFEADKHFHDIVEEARMVLGADIFCYISSAGYCEDIPELYHRVYTFGENDVRRMNHIVHVSGREDISIERIEQPASWTDLLYSEDPMRLCSEVRALLLKNASRGRLGQRAMMNFQQDLLQMFFNFMDKKGMVAHEMSEDPEVISLTWSALKSIDGMCDWTAACVRFLQKNGEGNLHRDSDRISKQVMQYIRDHVDGDLSVKSVADSVFMSPDHVSKVFRKETGEGLHDYIARVRIEKAKTLLKESDLSLTEIAVETGYGNTSYFIRAFRRSTGKTPKKYRQDVLANET